jgi:two-component system OmpR family response regulator
VNSSFHVLVVDDDQQIRTGLSRLLRESGFRATLAADGPQLMSALRDAKIDLVLLDIMLPGTDGLELCRRLRDSHNIPVIMLTAVTGNADRVIGLELGADDYICKPFDPRELVARIRSVLRRSNALPADNRRESRVVYVFEDWALDVVKRMLTSPTGALVDLTTGEFDLLHAFLEHPQRVLTRDQLLDIARGRSSVLFDRSIDVQISRLRRKIEKDPQRPLLIKTVRGGGYLFTAEVANR